MHTSQHGHVYLPASRAIKFTRAQLLYTLRQRCLHALSPSASAIPVPQSLLSAAQFAKAFVSLGLSSSPVCVHACMCVHVCMCVSFYTHSLSLSSRERALSALHLRCAAADRYNNSKHGRESATFALSHTMLSCCTPHSLSLSLSISLCAALEPTFRLCRPQRSSLRSRRFSFFSLWSTLFAERGKTFCLSRMCRRDQC